MIGSGIMAQRRTGDRAVALLANTVATGGALVAILLIFGPISGAHLNPAVTLSMVALKQQTSRSAVGYIAAQIAGGITGAILANTMFELSQITWSMTTRTGVAQLLSESVATFGLMARSRLWRRWHHSPTW